MLLTTVLVLIPTLRIIRAKICLDVIHFDVHLNARIDLFGLTSSRLGGDDSADHCWPVNAASRCPHHAPGLVLAPLLLVGKRP